MPNGKTHIIAGTTCGAISSIAIHQYFYKEKPIEPGNVLISAGAGAVVSRLPDTLEPALHPNHRAFFHSIAFGALLGLGVVQVTKIIKEEKDKRKAIGTERMSSTEAILILILIVIIVVLLHLAMDGFTKKGLPII
jgi:inner membrane protein